MSTSLPHNELTRDSIQPLIKARDPRSHKGNFGHALLVAGSAGRMGAAVMAAKACLRTGVGLLSVAVPQQERSILQTALPEAMLVFREAPIDFGEFNAAAIGPGLGTDEAAGKHLKKILKRFRQKNLVLDADALTLLSFHKKWWDHVSEGTILTPHPGEFDRLFGMMRNHEERIEKAIALSRETGWVIVLKNYQTLVTQEGNSWLNTTGNAGMAKGGSGDVLTGMILALLAQHYAPADAAKIGVYLHGLAGDLAVKKQSPESMLATDLVERIGATFRATRGGDSI